MKETDITVITRPDAVTFECPYCENRNKIHYGDFCDEHGEVCDWGCEAVVCGECEKDIKIGCIDWD